MVAAAAAAAAVPCMFAEGHVPDIALGHAEPPFAVVDNQERHAKTIRERPHPEQSKAARQPFPRKAPEEGAQYIQTHGHLDSANNTQILTLQEKYLGNATLPVRILPAAQQHSNKQALSYVNLHRLQFSIHK